MDKTDDLGYKSTEWLLDELERLINLEHGLYVWELEEHENYKEAIRDEIMNRVSI